MSSYSQTSAQILSNWVGEIHKEQWISQQKKHRSTDRILTWRNIKKLDLTTQIILTYFYVFSQAALQHFISGFPDLLNPNLTLAEERHIGFQS